MVCWTAQKSTSMALAHYSPTRGRRHYLMASRWALPASIRSSTTQQTTRTTTGYRTRLSMCWVWTCAAVYRRRRHQHRRLLAPTATPTDTPTPTSTQTMTPTITPTPTKQPEPGDTDGDGCSEQRENGPDETLGGLGDYKNPHDVYDVLRPGAHRQRTGSLTCPTTS